MPKMTTEEGDFFILILLRIQISSIGMGLINMGSQMKVLETQ